MLSIISQLLKTPSNVVFISDLMLVWFGVFIGLMVKNFYTKTLTDYTEDLMRMKNYKNYSIIFVTILLITSVLGTFADMGIISYYKINNFWLKFLIGIASGFLGISVIRTFVSFEMKGDRLPDTILRFINSWFKKKGISVSVNIGNEEPDDEPPTIPITIVAAPTPVNTTPKVDPVPIPVPVQTPTPPQA